jgi:gliding motility-associated-like protein
MRIRFSIIAVLAFTLPLFAQNSTTMRGANVGGACTNCVQPLDGSTTLGFTYKKDTCGLSYLTVSQKVGQRFTPAGVPQPATVSVSGLPACYYIEKAFLWCDASGSGTPITATITNPASVTQNFPMTNIGSDIDKCWGFPGTTSYRADVTSIISGNGNYVFSGFPVGPAGGQDDVDGFAMMIIYRDPTATWEGHINIWDGCVVIIGSTTTQVMTNQTVCANSSNQTAFMLVADLQGLGSNLSMNNSPPFTIAEDWWNYVDQPTAVFTTAQSSSSFNVSSSGDCYNFMMMGTYYQTTGCNTCIPSGNSVLNVDATGSGTCFPNQGSLSASVSGGQGPYSYQWQPGGGTTSSLTNQPYGTYTVNVVDASGCFIGSDTVTIAQEAYPVAQFSLSPAPTANYPGQLCMTDNTVGGAAWIWSVNGIPVDSTIDYCYTIPDTSGICVDLIVANAAGCLDTATQCVTVLGEAIISVPNVFTPNTDGNNDVFEVTWIGLTSLRCTIYDRWGVKVYEWDGLTGSWDGRTTSGKMATDGVYYWVVEATSLQNEAIDLHGFVHLISAK